MARQKKPKKPKNREAAFEAGFCTGIRCRQFVLNGSGVQVWDEKKNVFDRYCWFCYGKSLAE